MPLSTCVGITISDLAPITTPDLSLFGTPGTKTLTNSSFHIPKYQLFHERKRIQTPKHSFEKKKKENILLSAYIEMNWNY